MSSFVWPAQGGSGGGVTSLNTLTGDVLLAAGTGVVLIPSGNTITISSTDLAAAITSINSDVTTAQTLSVGTAGTNFAITDAGGGSHVFNLPVASATNTGKLSNTDWSTFNGKQATLTIGNLSDAGTDGIVVTGGTGAIIGSGVTLAQHVADTTHNGYLASADWNTFNGKQAAGSYITALTGDISASGPGSVASTLATVNTNVGSFGSATAVSAITVNGKGLVTAAASTAIQITESQVTNLTSDLAGKQAGPLTGDITTSGAASTLATVNSNVGSFTNASITVNAKGLVTAASTGTASSTFPYVSKTSAYTLLSTDYTVAGSTSGGTFALALPSAGNTGKVYVIRKAETNFNALSITGTIDGNSSRALYTLNESLMIQDTGSTFTALNHYNTTASAHDLTWTVNGFGTVTNQFVLYRRTGNTCKVFLQFNSGSTSGTASVTLPTGMTIDTGVINAATSGQLLGTMWRLSNTAFSGTTAGPWSIFFDGSTSSAIFMCKTPSGFNFAKDSAGSLAASSDTITLEFEIPVTGWW